MSGPSVDTTDRTSTDPYAEELLAEGDAIAQAGDDDQRADDDAYTGQTAPAAPTATGPSTQTQAARLAEPHIRTQIAETPEPFYVFTPDGGEPRQFDMWLSLYPRPGRRIPYPALVEARIVFGEILEYTLQIPLNEQGNPIWSEVMGEVLDHGNSRPLLTATLHEGNGIRIGNSTTDKFSLSLQYDSYGDGFDASSIQLSSMVAQPLIPGLAEPLPDLLDIRHANINVRTSRHLANYPNAAQVMDVMVYADSYFPRPFFLDVPIDRNRRILWEEVRGYTLDGDNRAPIFIAGPRDGRILIGTESNPSHGVEVQLFVRGGVPLDLHGALEVNARTVDIAKTTLRPLDIIGQIEPPEPDYAIEEKQSLPPGEKSSRMQSFRLGSDLDVDAFLEVNPRLQSERRDGRDAIATLHVQLTDNLAIYIGLPLDPYGNPQYPMARGSVIISEGGEEVGRAPLLRVGQATELLVTLQPGQPAIRIALTPGDVLSADGMDLSLTTDATVDTSRPGHCLEYTRKWPTNAYGTYQAKLAAAQPKVEKDASEHPATARFQEVTLAPGLTVDAYIEAEPRRRSSAADEDQARVHVQVPLQNAASLLLSIPLDRAGTPIYSAATGNLLFEPEGAPSEQLPLLRVGTGDELLVTWQAGEPALRIDIFSTPEMTARSTVLEVVADAAVDTASAQAMPATEVSWPTSLYLDISLDHVAEPMPPAPAPTPLGESAPAVVTDAELLSLPYSTRLQQETRRPVAWQAGDVLANFTRTFSLPDGSTVIFNSGSAIVRQAPEGHLYLAFDWNTVELTLFPPGVDVQDPASAEFGRSLNHRLLRGSWFAIEGNDDWSFGISVTTIARTGRAWARFTCNSRHGDPANNLGYYSFVPEPAISARSGTSGLTATIAPPLPIAGHELWPTLDMQVRGYRVRVPVNPATGEPDWEYGFTQNNGDVAWRLLTENGIATTATDLGEARRPGVAIEASFHAGTVTASHRRIDFNELRAGLTSSSDDDDGNESGNGGTGGANGSGDTTQTGTSGNDGGEEGTLPTSRSVAIAVVDGTFAGFEDAPQRVRVRLTDDLWDGDLEFDALVSQTEGEPAVRLAPEPRLQLTGDLLEAFGEFRLGENQGLLASGIDTGYSLAVVDGALDATATDDVADSWGASFTGVACEALPVPTQPEDTGDDESGRPPLELDWLDHAATRHGGVVEAVTLGPGRREVYIDVDGLFRARTVVEFDASGHGRPLWEDADGQASTIYVEGYDEDYAAPQVSSAPAFLRFPTEGGIFGLDLALVNSQPVLRAVELPANHQLPEVETRTLVAQDGTFSDPVMGAHADRLAALEALFAPEPAPTPDVPGDVNGTSEGINAPGDVAIQRNLPFVAPLSLQRADHYVTLARRFYTYPGGIPRPLAERIENTLLVRDGEVLRTNTRALAESSRDRARQANTLHLGFWLEWSDWAEQNHLFYGRAYYFWHRVLDPVGYDNGARLYQAQHFERPYWVMQALPPEALATFQQMVAYTTYFSDAYEIGVPTEALTAYAAAHPRVLGPGQFERAVDAAIVLAGGNAADVTAVHFEQAHTQLNIPELAANATQQEVDPLIRLYTSRVTNNFYRGLRPEISQRDLATYIMTREDDGRQAIDHIMNNVDLAASAFNWSHYLGSFRYYNLARAVIENHNEAIQNVPQMREALAALGINPEGEVDEEALLNAEAFFRSNNGVTLPRLRFAATLAADIGCPDVFFIYDLCQALSSFDLASQANVGEIIAFAAEIRHDPDALQAYADHLMGLLDAEEDASFGSTTWDQAGPDTPWTALEDFRASLAQTNAAQNLVAREAALLAEQEARAAELAALETRRWTLNNVPQGPRREAVREVLAELRTDGYDVTGSSPLRQGIIRLAASHPLVNPRLRHVVTTTLAGHGNNTTFRELDTTWANLILNTALADTLELSVPALTEPGATFFTSARISAIAEILSARPSELQEFARVLTSQPWSAEDLEGIVNRYEALVNVWEDEQAAAQPGFVVPIDDAALSTFQSTLAASDLPDFESTGLEGAYHLEVGAHADDIQQALHAIDESLEASWVRRFATLGDMVQFLHATDPDRLVEISATVQRAGIDPLSQPEMVLAEVILTEAGAPIGTATRLSLPRPELRATLVQNLQARGVMARPLVPEVAAPVRGAISETTPRRSGTSAPRAPTPRGR